MGARWRGVLTEREGDLWRENERNERERERREKR